MRSWPTDLANELTGIRRYAKRTMGRALLRNSKAASQSVLSLWLMCGT